MNCVDGICYEVDSETTPKPEVPCKSGENNSIYLEFMLCLIIYVLSYKIIHLRELYCDYDWSLKYLLLPKRNTITRMIYALIYIPILIIALIRRVICYVTIIIIINYIYNNILKRSQQTVHHPVNDNNRQEHNRALVVSDEHIYENIDLPHVVLDIDEE